MAAKRKQRSRTKVQSGRGDGRRRSGRAQATRAEVIEPRVGQRMQRMTGALEGEAAGKASSMAREAGEAARKAGRSALGAARRHPVPVALTGVGAACAGIGVAWLLLGQRRGAATNGSSDPNVAERGGREKGSRVEELASTAQRIVHRASDEGHELAQRAQASIGPAAQRVRGAARDAFAETQL
jgi:hypothetical protein